MQPIVGVVADDLTGGMETAAMLVALGVGVGFATRPDSLRGMPVAPAMVLAQKTRVIPAAEAVAKSEAAAHALLELGVRQLFFKYCATFDSTDRGNIGPVAERLLDMTGASFTAYCPSGPVNGRTVYSGHLFVGTELVSDSPKRFDPLTPMTDPNLVRVLQRQTVGRVGLLPHASVRQGGEKLRLLVEELAGQGVRHFVADAIYDEDLAAIAALTVDWRVMTGNAPIMQHYPNLWRARGWLSGEGERRPLPAVAGPGVVLAGSCADRTLEQLRAFEAARPVLWLDVASAEGVGQALAEALHWTLARLGEGPVAIATSASPDDVRRAQDRFGRDGAARFAEDVLGALAVSLRDAGVRRFLVAGGETSGTVVERLGIDRLHIGAYQGPGVARAVTEDADPVALCLKSGKLGPVGMFLPTLESMKHPEV
ncbi:MAG: four-carbon acid sugar kinase family protein [Rhizobiaceae bacterium]|nr:four-carbon acid sugar kinase family protein [Rhizobiaceae bacterium]